jgi:hypothetical protein
MSGLVGVIANDSARYTLFSACIDKLTLPEGWTKEWVIGGDWCGARNGLCERVLESDATHLWFMDDDHAFAPSLLTRLLAHDEALVTPICLTRTYPFQPVQYVEKIADALYLPVPLGESEAEGLIEIQAGGCAGMLIRRDVIEAIEPPWFEYTDRSEDIIFCEKAKAAGFKLHADLSCRLGHITTAVVEPAVRGGEWTTGFTIGRDLRLFSDTADNVVAEKPGSPAQVQTWVWTLVRVLSNQTLARLLIPADIPFNWQPAVGTEPEGVLQWYCDEGMGEGPKPVGDKFSFWERKE